MITWQEAKVKQPAMTIAMPNTGQKNESVREKIVHDSLELYEKEMPIRPAVTKNVDPQWC